MPKENLLGPLNQGWQVLVSTLMHERFGIGETIGGTEQTLAQLVEIARGAIIDGRSAAEDDEIRQQIAQFAIEVTAKKYNGLRALSKRLKGQQPGAEASIGKLVSTELSQRMVKYSRRACSASMRCSSDAHRSRPTATGCGVSFTAKA